MAQITYENASCFYENSDTPAVDDLNLDIADGEFLVLVGPSGSGKSTALRMLAGLESVDEGRITIGSRDVTHMSPKDRDIAMVFQNYALYPNKTVADNMGFPLKMQQVPKDERDRKVREAAKLLDLEPFLGRKPRALSGGQRQRVAMGRAIVREPQVFLMDEPLSNLDAKLRVQTRTQIAALQRRLGVTTVYVTHDQVEAMTMGDRVAVLMDGKLQQCATPDELYDDPVNVFVAGFIGSPAMNLHTVPLGDGGATIGHRVVKLPESLLAAAVSQRLDHLTIGVRPEHLRVVAPEDGIVAEVQVIEELGADAFLHTQTFGDGGTPLDMVARAGGRSGVRPGGQVGLQIDAERVLGFHPETGARLAA